MANFDLDDDYKKIVKLLVDYYQKYHVLNGELLKDKELLNLKEASENEVSFEEVGITKLMEYCKCIDLRAIRIRDQIQSAEQSLESLKKSKIFKHSFIAKLLLPVNGKYELMQKAISAGLKHKFGDSWIFQAIIMTQKKAERKDQEAHVNQQEAELSCTLENMSIEDSLVAVISVSTFNPKGKHRGEDRENYKNVLQEVPPISLHHIQEPVWTKVDAQEEETSTASSSTAEGEQLTTPKKKIPEKKGISPGPSPVLASVIFPSKFNVTSPNKEAAIAFNEYFLKKEDFSVAGTLPDELQGRFYCCKLSAIKTFKVSKQVEICGSGHGDFLQFLSFSFHGHHSSYTDEQKLEEIKAFIKCVEDNCEREKLPAIIGGDFNLDIKKLENENIKIFNRYERPQHIDFLCIVCFDKFETKISMLEASGSTYVRRRNGTTHPFYYEYLMLHRSQKTDDSGHLVSTHA